MVDYQCSCGNPLEYKTGKCKDCRELDNQRKIDRSINRTIAKVQETVEWGVSQVKKYAEGRCWCSAHEGCFSPDMTILTKNGWKKFDELKNNEIVATLNYKKELEYNYIFTKVIEDCNKIYHYKDSKKEVFCSGEHTFLHKDERIMIKDFIKSKKREIISPITSKWIGKEKEFILPSTLKIINNKYNKPTYKTIPSKKLNPHLFAKLLGIYIAEGCLFNYKHNKGIHISCYKEKEYYKIKKLIEDLGFHPSPQQKKPVAWVIYDQGLLSYFKQFGKSWEKYLPQWIKDQPIDIINSFLEYYCMGDGCIYNDRGTTRRCFHTTSNKLAEDVQELIIKTGKSASIRKQIRDKTNKCQHPRPIYRIYERSRKNVVFSRKNWSIQKYHDKVYCVNVPNHTILINKEYPFWTGNCFRCSFGKSETPLHRDTKYERWKYHKELGRQVFCELRLKPPFGRPDLIVVDKGFIFIEEIVVSEKEASLVEKKKKYPWPINIIKAEKGK